MFIVTQIVDGGPACDMGLKNSIYSDAMGRSLELFEQVHNSITEGGRSTLVWEGCTLLGRLTDPRELLRVDEDDTSLEALRKVDMAHNTPLKDIPGYVSPTFEIAVDRIKQLTGIGVREGFLVRSILDNAEEMMQMFADRQHAMNGLENQKSFADFMDEQAAADSPENTQHRTWAREQYEKSAAEFEERLAVRQEDYRRWTEVVGPWLEKPRFMGGWQELEASGRRP